MKLIGLTLTHQIYKVNEYCAICYRRYSKFNNFYFYILPQTELRNTSPESTRSIAADNRFGCALPLFGPPVALNEGIMQREEARLVQHHQASHVIQSKINWPPAGPTSYRWLKQKLHIAHSVSSFSLRGSSISQSNRSLRNPNTKSRHLKGAIYLLLYKEAQRACKIQVVPSISQ